MSRTTLGALARDLVRLARATKLPMRLLGRQRPASQRNQHHGVDVQRVGQADQILRPVDVHLALFPPDRARMFEAKNVG
jgi:hypothetical protein